MGGPGDGGSDDQIGNALQEGTNVVCYNQKNLQQWSKKGELMGYTSTTVNIKEGNQVYMYNIKGLSQGNRPA